MGECVAKSPPTGDQIHHLQCIEWESSVASPEIGTPSHSFPLTTSSPLALAKGSQGIGGGAPTNHELPNQKFVERHQLFMYYDLAKQ
jgi:hypothetical protein